VKNFVSMIFLAASLLPETAGAQTMPPNETGVTMGHLHLNSRDVEANKKIFVGMGGESLADPGAPLQSVRFPGVIVILNLRQGTPPESGPSEGTVINHVGFLVPNVQDAVAKWKAAGVPVLPGNNGRLDQANVFTPDGLRIEILEDKDQKVPIRFQHVHFFVPEAAVPEIQMWYGKNFGAKPSMRGNNKSADVPGANLTFSKTDKPTVPTKGRILDHIGFDVVDLEAAAKRFEDNGIKLDRAIETLPNGVKLLFIHDPWGTNIEVNQRPHPM
jgi:catechol 2,3-dioxygenase-like lactoylglutathione lyase family enzyme/predicted enzyme related to lactoylglutathione lyase